MMVPASLVAEATPPVAEGSPERPSPEGAEAALAVTGLSHAFGRRVVLDQVDFAIRPGDFTVLLGLNGAGKTTLFALVTRLYHAHTGHIRVFGRDMRRDPQAALARMGVVFQQSTLDLDLTVEQNLHYHAALHGLASSVATPRIAAEIDRVGLSARRRDRVRALSGGQRRRVELARALIHDPALLLLDEPTAGLDVESRHFLLEHVRQLCAERRLAVLWATHLFEEAVEDARVIVLHGGRVLADDRAAELAFSGGGGGLRAAFERMTAVANVGSAA